MRKILLTNIVLTFIWTLLTGDFHWYNFLLGFVLSFIFLWVTDNSNKTTRYFRYFPKVISFLLFFIYELTKANIQVAYEVITPNYNMKPGIVKIPLDLETDVEITLLASLITLTPGTLSLDVSKDKKVLYVHSMYIYDRADFIAGIKNGFETKIIELLR
jgi:multicomponent Na+:H+ antiporter subunit E